LLKVKFTAAERLRMHLVMSGTRVERGKGLGGCRNRGRSVSGIRIVTPGEI
jgi:hypothetical protein